MIGDMRFLLFTMGEKLYLCRESLIERIVSVKKEDLYSAPIGPPWLKYLMVYDGMVIPIIKEHEEILCEKMYNIVILKKVFNFVGFFIDFIEKFVDIDEDVISKAIFTPVFMAQKAIIFDDRECYLLDIDALLEGRE